MRQISVTELRNKVHDILEGVKYHRERYVIATFGRPMAVLLSVEEYEQMSGTIVAPADDERGQSALESQ